MFFVRLSTAFLYLELFRETENMLKLSPFFLKASPNMRIGQKRKKCTKNMKNTKIHTFWWRSVERFTLFEFFQNPKNTFFDVDL